MIKSNLKLLITFFIIMLLSFTPLCLATDIVTPISQTIQDSNEQEDTTNNTRYADLYISDESKYDITNTIEGNVFASVDTLNIVSGLLSNTIICLYFVSLIHSFEDES